MMWTYKIVAAARPRMLMRIAQLFDQQMLEMSACEMVRTGSDLTIVITVDADAELARRIHAKLYKLEDVMSVELAAPTLVSVIADQEIS